MTEAFIHPNAICEAMSVGPGTRIWAFAHVLPGARLGVECNICDGVFIENDVVIGDRVTIKCGVQLWDGISVEDDVFIGPNATFTNDRFPRSKVYPDAFARTIVRQGASIGANATILPGIEIGVGAMVGAGAVVTRSVPPNAIVVGNPARIKGYVTDTDGPNVSPSPESFDEALASTPLKVGRSSLHTLRIAKDMRGELSVGEFGAQIPFTPERYFLVYNVPGREVRGEHAHKQCEQFLVCVRGSCNVLLDDGERRTEVTLDKPNLGLYMPPMIWGTQYRYSPDAVLLVFASHRYDPDDYIRSYDQFRLAVNTAADSR
ncbi:WxcM-like domain-containing protein [Microvirga subterranea]|uniref:Acetyltransferase-like isoleucine patch superfamily enzyme n=1 Tax=Microvirga subterranea TaxID=186651 RepID=A0A370HJL0_9HYPH|nr:WxcM-like domain-containing protein [Microvirga subterranea]RDI58540.1 acetyltransferase-like isoleucine patch superfamily enzyme [Microvirga subterranea]